MSGTYADGHVPSVAFVVALLLALFMMATPSAGMLWVSTSAAADESALSEAPTLFDGDGVFNLDVLADAGSYFEGHFAFRNEMLTLNARLRALIGSSAIRQVVVGSDGWQYYSGTLPDFLGETPMSDRALRNAAHNLLLVQSYSESCGASFVFAAAPNKNSLYPEHMPYYYLKSPAKSNAERLFPILAEMGVHYVNLFDKLREIDGERYLKRDSHWDNRGALVAAQAILASIGRKPVNVDMTNAIEREDFFGDLEGMQYPADQKADVNWYFEGYNDGENMSGSHWNYLKGENVTDGWIRTESDNGEGVLLMFRDSFGNSLLPFLAPTFHEAAFSKYVPYNLVTLTQMNSDAVVIERAERNLVGLSEDPPIVVSPKVNIGNIEGAHVPDGQASVSLAATSDESYWKLQGAIESPLMTDESPIFVSVRMADGTMRVYDALWMSVPEGEGTNPSDYGYQLYVNKSVGDLQGAKVDVLTMAEGEPVLLGTFENVTFS